MLLVGKPRTIIRFVGLGVSPDSRRPKGTRVGKDNTPTSDRHWNLNLTIKMEIGTLA